MFLLLVRSLIATDDTSLAAFVIDPKKRTSNEFDPHLTPRRNLVLCVDLVNASEKCKFTFFKHPSVKWATSGCSSSASKIAAPRIL